MLAVQTGIPILPVTCNGAFQVLPKKSLLIRPGHITVTVGEPVPCDGTTEKDVPELMERTRREVEENLKADYDPFNPRQISTP
jgi:1-acyl-sn-glycerol-3-phosphate acyltransferase